MKMLALALLLACAPAAQAAPAADDLLPASVEVAGESQADWSRDWWLWAFSFERAQSPVADPTGALCAAGQHGPVWFLAGTYGTKRVVRNCTVPAGKYLFFPLVDYLVTPSADGSPSCADVAGLAADETEQVANLVLEVDGRRYGGLEAHRLVTRGCFDAGARANPPRSKYPSAGNGYYVMLRPLPPGRHRIEFGGMLPDIVQAVTYTIDVR